MYSRQRLSVYGYHNEAVPHTFFRQPQETDHAVIVLPGIGYSCQQPLLYYSTREFLQQGADVLWIEYNQRDDFTSLSETEVIRCALADTSAACQAFLSERPYQRVTFIGKSLGTATMVYMLNTLALPAMIQTIWLTPLLRRQELRNLICEARPRSLFIVGTADPHYDKHALLEVQMATRGDTLIIENADHSLEIANDIIQSLQAMERIIQAIQAFCVRNMLAYNHMQSGEPI